MRKNDLYDSGLCCLVS